MKGKPEMNSENQIWTKKNWKIVYFSWFDFISAFINSFYLFGHRNNDKI